jgi:hypothetical protein
VKQPDAEGDDDRNEDQAEEEVAELCAAHDALQVRLVYRVMATNRRVCSVSACSVGSRSMLDAP